MVSIPLMTTVVPVDRAGRIVIPKETREAQGIAAGTKFLLIEGKDGSLWLQRLDPQELARRIHEELRGIDLAPPRREDRSRDGSARAVEIPVRAASIDAEGPVATPLPAFLLNPNVFVSALKAGPQ